MPVLPEDVAAATFPRRWRGYARPEVEAFLRQVAEDYAAAIARIATTAADRSRSATATDDLVRQLGAVVESAQRGAEQVRQDAHAETDAIRARAEQAATTITGRAEEAAAALTGQAEALRTSAQRDADAARERLAAADRRAQDIEDAARARWDALRVDTERRWDELHAAERRLAERRKVAHDAVTALRSKVALLEQVEQVEHQLATLTTTSDPAAADVAAGETRNGPDANHSNGHRLP